MALQSIGSIVCGQYCIYYLALRILGKVGRASVMKLLNRNTPFVNDNYVNEFVRTHFNVKVDAYSVDVLIQLCKPFFME